MYNNIAYLESTAEFFDIYTDLKKEKVPVTYISLHT